MKPLTRLAFTALLLAALAPSLRAEFLVVGIRESTAESIRNGLLVFSSLLVLATLNKSRSNGGGGH